MLWWKHIERVHENVMMIEREERTREYVDSTTLTLTLPTRDPVLQDNLLIANLEQVKSLQASLFPICTKGTFAGNLFDKICLTFLQYPINGCCTNAILWQITKWTKILASISSMFFHWWLQYQIFIKTKVCTKWKYKTVTKYYIMYNNVLTHTQHKGNSCMVQNRQQINNKCNTF